MVYYFGITILGTNTDVKQATNECSTYTPKFTKKHFFNNLNWKKKWIRIVSLSIESSIFEA